MQKKKNHKPFIANVRQRFGLVTIYKKKEQEEKDFGGRVV